jgi:UDPglucose 6-dehydrogenase
MSLVNAELAKLAVNTFVTTKISFANLLAEICEQLPGADAEVVTTAIGLDSRIGRRYLQGATGYGGPCFPRDNRAFSVLATSVGERADIAEATDAINRRQVERLVQRVLAWLPGEARVTVLGLSYKPHTHVIDMSTGVAVAAALSERGVRVTVYDPASMAEARQILGARVTYGDNAVESVGSAAVTVIATAWPEFSELTESDFEADGRPVVIDCWGVLDRCAITGRVRVVRVGRGEKEGQPW